MTEEEQTEFFDKRAKRPKAKRSKKKKKKVNKEAVQKHEDEYYMKGNLAYL